MDDGEQDEAEGGGGGVDPELIKSYVRFFRRALRAHRVLLSAVFVSGLVLTVLAYRYLPRTYSCTTILMVDASQVLEGNNGGGNGLLAAQSLIMRHENLERIVRDTGLLTTYRARRPPLLHLKDQLLASLFGEMNDEVLMAVLVGTLESKLNVKVENGTLTVSVDWTDGNTAAQIAETARESYVKNRHVAEMSAFEEKLSILDGHAASLRDEIEGLAEQSRSLLRQRERNERTAARATTAQAETTDLPLPVARPRAHAAQEAEDPELPRLKEELDAKRKKLADMDQNREQRIQEERRKIEDLKLKLTPSHPEVQTAQQRLALLEQEPSELSLLRSEVQSLEGELKQREFMGKRLTPSSGLRSATSTAGTAVQAPDPLPGEITQLLDAGQIDPALAAQLSSAISKYAALRDDIRTARIQFDTAQAAFNFRYKVVVPAEAPKSPAKPKAAMVLGAGFFLSLILAIALPLVTELRSGIIVERWQVAMVQVPVLAELRLPPAGGDRPSAPISTRHG
jgi:uncharacterized protein involved in exopolysaccharide biosynthesis